MNIYATPPKIQLYDNPENAENIERLYLSGLPKDTIDIGVTCWLSYEFSGHEDETLNYLKF